MYYCIIYGSNSKVLDGIDLSPEELKQDPLTYLGSFSFYNLKEYKNSLIKYQTLGPIKIVWMDNFIKKGASDVYW